MSKTSATNFLRKAIRLGSTFLQNFWVMNFSLYCNNSEVKKKESDKQNIQEGSLNVKNKTK